MNKKIMRVVDHSAPSMSFFVDVLGGVETILTFYGLATLFATW